MLESINFADITSIEEAYAKYKNATEKEKFDMDAECIHEHSGTMCWLYHYLHYRQDNSYEPEFFSQLTERQRTAFWERGFYDNEGAWNSMLLFDEDNPIFYRGKVETLILDKPDKIFMSLKKEDALDSYRVPGGSFEKGKPHNEQAVAECREEAYLMVGGLKYSGISYIIADINQPSRYKDDELRWHGKYVEVYTAESHIKYNGFVNVRDRDADMKKNGKFHSLAEVKDILRPEHLKALINIGFGNITVQESATLNEGNGDIKLFVNDEDEHISANMNNASITISREQYHKAKDAMKNNPNIKLVYPTRHDMDIEELEAMYNDFTMLPEYHKSQSNDQSISIFGDTVESIYYLLAKNVSNGKVKHAENTKPVGGVDSNTSNTTVNDDLSKPDMDDIFTYFTPDELDSIGTFNEDSKLNFYKVPTQLKDKSWYEDYRNGEFNKTLWVKNTRNIYLECMANPTNENKQKLLEQGWNPEIPFTRDILIQHSKLKMRELNEAISGGVLLPVFIVTVFTGTLFGKAIKAYLHSTYSHSAIGLTPELDHLYSFNAKGLDDQPGISIESVKGYEQENSEADIAVSAFFIKPKDYKLLSEKLEWFVEHKEETKYNFKNLINIITNKASETKDSMSMVCTQFVDSMMKMVGVDVTNKPSNLVTPDDLHENEKNKNKIFTIFEGIVSKYSPTNAKRKIATILRTRTVNECCFLENYSEREQLLDKAEKIITNIAGKSLIDKESKDAFLNVKEPDIGKVGQICLGSYTKENYTEIFNTLKVEMKDDPVKFKKDNYNTIFMAVTDSKILKEAKEFPIEFNNGGDLLVKNFKKADYEAEYYKSVKLLKMYKDSNNIEGIKYELCRLWFIIIVLSQRGGNDNMKIVAKAKNSLSQYIQIVQTAEPDFNLDLYFKDSCFNDDKILIKKSTLTTSAQLIKKLFS